MRTIRITGKGLLKVKPDTTRVTIELSGTYKSYEESLKHSAKDTEAVKDLIAALGFERSDLKTLRFSVDTRYEYVNGERKFLGYKYEHDMKIEFKSNNELLGKILAKLAKCPQNPELHLGYTVSDPEAAKNELLGKAAADAKAKAEVLTKAAGVTLGEIQNIDYSWGRVEFEYEPAELGIIEHKEISVDFDMDIEPDDIEMTDTVTVIWEIK